MRRFIILALLLVGCNRPPEVRVTPVARMDLVDSFRELAETRLSKTYPVAMPVAGRIGRVELEPGDPVSRGQILAVLDRVALESELNEEMAAVREAQAQLGIAADCEPERREVERAEALLRESRRRVPVTTAHLRAARETHEQQEIEARRVEALVKQGALPSQDAEQARLRATTAGLAVQEARASWQAAEAEAGAFASGLEAAQAQLRRREKEKEVAAERLERARAAIASSGHEVRQAHLRSPIDGLVIERHLQGPSNLPAGEVVLTLGRPRDMEVVAEVLTQQAQRLRPGMPVVLRSAPPAAPLSGAVRRIEPSGFTKLSSLGVEQKRVRVIISLKSGISLGAGYRLEAEFLVGRRQGVLGVARQSLLQRPDGRFFVLVVRSGKLCEQEVEVGVAEDLRVEILGGLGQGEPVVSTPDSGLKAGTEVRPLLDGENLD